MEWPGIREDLGATEPGMDTMTNVSLSRRGECRRRPGLGLRVTGAGRVITDHTDPANNRRIVVRNSSGALQAILNGLAAVSLKTGLNTDVPGTFAKGQGRTYYANDFDPVQVVDQIEASAARDAGLVASDWLNTPGVSSGGSVTEGDHLMRYRWYNSRTLYYSNPSNSVTRTIASPNQTIVVRRGNTGSDHIDPANAPSGADQVIIEMTAAGGTAYYVVGYYDFEVTGGGGNVALITTADATLIQGEVIDADSDGFGHAPPPLLLLMAEHGGFMFGIGNSVRAASVTTDGTKVVTGTGFSPDWEGRTLEIEGSRYTIAAATTTSLTLTESVAEANSTYSAKVYAARRDTLYWSYPGRPESWRTATRARLVFTDQSDTPSALVSYYGDLLILGQSTIRRLTFTNDPAAGRLTTVPTEHGVWNQRCLIKADGVLYGWGRNGVWSMRGVVPDHISKPIDAKWRDAIDASQFVDFHGAYDPIERSLTWWYTETSDTEPARAICLDLDTGQWTERTWRQGIIASATTYDSAGNSYLTVSDENGYTWYQQIGEWDGVPTGESAVYTVAAGATGTSIPVDEALDTATGFAGVVAYFPANGETAVVSSNTGTTFTLASSVTVPTDGQEVWLGSIAVEIRTKWMVFGGFERKDSPQYLSVGFVPTSASSEIEVYFYRNFASTAETATKNAADFEPDAVTLTHGSAKRILDQDAGSGVDGYVDVPVSAEFGRAWQWRMVQTEPVGTLRLQHVEFVANARSSREVVGE